ncbi:RVT_3 domain-containing protein [Cephalotus follicularis]|uniref:RVT_3 domain-containing protein n=1 Tax=Cephalotus follicularis TaxID=3775 RepID=A0A1Q3CY31_CEPFO|nr:RVT_3 domain-containing protein [Cephalotus follicularis]
MASSTLAIKFNCDGAFDGNEHCGGAGIVARNDKGEVMLVVAFSSPRVLDPPTTEAWSLLLAMQEAMRNNWRRIIVESDTKLVIQDIRNVNPSLSKIGNVLENIKTLTTSFVYCLFS